MRHWEPAGRQPSIFTQINLTAKPYPSIGASPRVFSLQLLERTSFPQVAL